MISGCLKMLFALSLYLIGYPETFFKLAFRSFQKCFRRLPRRAYGTARNDDTGCLKTLLYKKITQNNLFSNKLFHVKHFIVGSYQNHTAFVRLAVLFILSAANRLVCFWSEPTILSKRNYFNAAVSSGAASNRSATKP